MKWPRKMKNMNLRDKWQRKNRENRALENYRSQGERQAK